ncbi:MAG: glutaredoxin [Albidovulum sp.]|nr:glutaredoxin [Albidovulum sp.]
MPDMQNSRSPVSVLLYKWAGAWGPFSVKIPCGECSLTVDVINDTLSTDLAGVPVNLEIRDWLTEWWRPLPKGGWHAPIVLVEGRLVSQGNALNRGVLTEAIINAHARNSELSGNHLFGKATCPHCVRAKEHLQNAGMAFEYRDVVKNPRDLYEMLARVKPIIGHKTPVTVPQIWIDGRYVGGADQLSEIVDARVEPNPDRGRCSMSAA